MFSRRLLLTSACAAALSLTLPSLAWADEPMPVVATFSVLGDMVERIGAEHVKVTTLVGLDGDAHVYQPTPQAARFVAEADVLFLNGLEFEGWLERLAEAAPFSGSLVVTTKGVEAIAFDEHDDHDDHDDEHDDEHDEHNEHNEHNEHKDEHAEDKDHDQHSDDHAEDEDHSDHADEHDEDHEEKHGDEHDDHGDEHDEHDEHDEEHAEDEHHDDHDDHGDEHAGHDHGAFDPHAWHSLENAVIFVDNITAGLAQADPDNAGTYYANRASYVAEIETLAAEVQAMMAAIPENKRTVVTSHDAFGYFAKAYDLTFEAPQGLSTESEPSAGDVAELIEQIRDDNISAVFIESITDNRLMQQIANETGATIGGTLYSDALSGADGPASTYLDMIRHNATTLASALGQ